MRMSIRAVAILVALLDHAIWLAVGAVTFFSGSDPATKSLDNLAGLAVTALFLATGAPALMLAATGRAPRLALTLSIVFPAAFAVLFIVAIFALS
jgi:hypothetical protein